MALQWLRAAAATIFETHNTHLAPGQAGIVLGGPDKGKFKVGQPGTGSDWNDEEYVNVVPSELAAVDARKGDTVDSTLILRGAHDRILSGGLSGLAQEAWCWNDPLDGDPVDPTQLDATVWEIAGTPVVDNDAVFGAHCSLREIQNGAFRYRALARVRFKPGAAANRITGVLVTGSTAAAIQGGSFVDSIGIYIDNRTTNNGHVFVRAANDVFDLGGPAPVDSEWMLTITRDEIYGMGLTARTTDGSYEVSRTFTTTELTGFAPDRFGIYSSDDRDVATGSSVKGIGFRASHATILPRLALEGAGPTTVVGQTTSQEDIRVALPANYDSRFPSPLVIYCHGGGGDAFELGDPGNIEYWNAITDGGAILATGAFLANGTPNGGGAPEAVDAVLSAYQWIRDRFHIGPVFITGYSMGGLTAIRVQCDLRLSGVSGVIVGAPPTNMEWFWENREDPVIAPLVPDFYQGWGIDEEATRQEFLDATLPGDVSKYLPSKFRSAPLIIMTSPDDEVVDEDQNGKALAEKLSDTGLIVVHVPTTGPHNGSASFPPNQVADIITRLAYTNPSY